MSARQTWAEFVGRHGERLLYTRGGAAYSDRTTLGEAETESFLQRLAAGDADVQFLARLLYLARPHVQSFFRNSLPGLLRGASHVTTGRIEISERGVRGKVVWPSTLHLQSSGRGHAGTFVIRRSEKSSDALENQLLRLYLIQVATATAAATRLVGTGEVPRSIDEIRRLAETGLREAAIRNVTSVLRATSIMRTRAKRHRNRHYGELATLQHEFDQVISYGKWDATVALASMGWLEPLSDDDLFELYILVLVLDILSDEMGFGPPDSYGLLRSGRAEVAQFFREVDGTRALVHFDQGPSKAFSFREGRYQTTLESYSGISGPEHRPDISIRFVTSGGVERNVLIEAKMTSNPDYMRESVYKCFGYLYDFADLWDETPGQRPKIILVFPEGVSPTPRSDTAGDELAITSATDRSRLAALIASVAP